MITRILFGTDFRDESDRAEQLVLDLASRLRASVVILHAIEPLAIVRDEEPDEEFYASLQAEAYESLREVEARFTARDIAVDLRVTVGHRWHELIDVATAEGASLIVVGARNLTPRDRPVLGTTSHQVFLASPLPVLVVRSPEESDE